MVLKHYNWTVASAKKLFLVNLTGWVREEVIKMQICLHEQNTKVIPVNIRSAGTRSCQTGIWTEPSPKGSLSC